MRVRVIRVIRVIRVVRVVRVIRVIRIIRVIRVTSSLGSLVFACDSSFYCTPPSRNISLLLVIHSHNPTLFDLIIVITLIALVHGVCQSKDRISVYT